MSKGRPTNKSKYLLTLASVRSYTADGKRWWTFPGALYAYRSKKEAQDVIRKAMKARKAREK